MKLFVRLIEAGTFIFWRADEGETSFNLKISIFAGDEKINLVDIDSSLGQNYYSFDRVGSGEYEIELNAYKDGTLSQTETKKINIISSVQKSEENFQAVMRELGTIGFSTSAACRMLSDVNSNIIDLYNRVISIKKALTDPETIVGNRKRLQKYEKNLY